ncbi:MAG: hypothetical protein DHS20C02_20620 [Micavibrio sp.]|nr:MAG: hypothetical protein DHS20C02_20620 [Micavibrio sp.]
MTRENLTLEQAMSSQLIVLITNDQQPGYKRLYFMQKKILVARPSFAKVRTADIEAVLWTSALNRTGSPEYLLVDLTKKNKLF